MTWKDLAEHTSALVALLGIFAGIAGFLFWRLITGISKKLSWLCENTTKHVLNCAEKRGECNQDNLKTFVTKDEFGDWKEGRNGPGGLWETINSHTHEGNPGAVVRRRK